ncbi:hypothetical protein [Comamonas composti]|uniref:hypothetical protein n=1 Tax=Comamonas composti TaxID=408558 RepID=UPI0004028AE2|nr:hypothetical protein [Comamonas composti]
MSNNLRWLIWLAALVAFSSPILEWDDELTRMRPEIERMKHLRTREHNAITAVDWAQQKQLAAKAQLTWLERLPPVTQSGGFRAEAMESLGELCNKLKAGCRVSAQGETVITNAINTPGARNAPAQLTGLIYSNVRVTVPLAFPDLDLLIEQIEHGPVLRNIEKFIVRSGNADIHVRTYGLEAAAWQRLQAAAQQDIQANLPEQTEAPAASQEAGASL